MARPGVSDFIRECLARYDVAIYSSTTWHNIKPLLDEILPEELLSQLKFVWTRDHTRLDPSYGQEGYHYLRPFDTVKDLHYVFDNPAINVERCYDLSNTLIVDNEERKVRLNPEENCMIWEEYVPDNTEKDRETLNNMFNLIGARFEALELTHADWWLEDGHI